MSTAKIDGINIYYESHGTDFPLVFAYGIGGTTGAAVAGNCPMGRAGG